MTEKEFEGYPIHRQVDSEGRLLTAWKPTIEQFRKLTLFMRGPVEGELVTHICPSCGHHHVLAPEFVANQRHFECFDPGCEFVGSFSEAHLLAENHIQSIIDDIFG